MYGFDETGLVIPAGTTKVRYFKSSQIMLYYATATSGITGVNTLVALKLGKGNSTYSIDVLVAETVATLQTAFTYIALTVYRDITGAIPKAGAGTLRYYQPAVIQKWRATTTTGVTGVNSAVTIQTQYGNGQRTGDLLVAETVTAIATLVG